MSVRTERTARRLIQITDLHLGADKNYSLASVRPYDSLSYILDHIIACGHGADQLLLSGDLAADEQMQAYQLLNDCLRQRGMEAVWLPGNHDCIARASQHMVDYPRQRVVELGPWVLLLLDSTVSGLPGGRFSDSELAVTDQLLQSCRGRPVMVAMHHCPVALGSDWVDRQRIENHAQLYALLAAHGDVKGVICGHVHQQAEVSWAGIEVYCTPSSCVQFLPGARDFTLSASAPGYRCFELYDDHTADSAVVLMEDFAQRPDPSHDRY